jgi:hypothetical protein
MSIIKSLFDISIWFQIQIILSLDPASAPGLDLDRDLDPHLRMYGCRFGYLKCDVGF